MATGLFTLTSLLVALGAATTDHWATNHRNLNVPVKFVERRAELRQLILYVSSDEGKTWNESAVNPPDKENFPFYAPTDGMYWMKLCAVYRDGTRSPSDINKGEASLKILIDTLKPVVRIISAERQGDGISVRWEIQEEHPDKSSLKLEYRAADDPSQQWYTQPIDPLLNGSTRLRLPVPGSVSIRLQVRDTAGNAGMDVVEVPAVSGGQGTAGSLIMQASAATVAPAAPMLPNIPNNPSPPPPAPVPRSDVAYEYPTAHTAPQSRPREVPVTNAWGSAQGDSWATSSGTSAPRILGSSENRNGSAPSPAAVSENAYRTPRGPLPPKQIINSTRVTLQFEVKSKGPSGIGRVEVWYTEDDGQKWEKLPDQTNVESSLTVDLPGERVFGLRVVPYSKAGRGRPPWPGDAPEMIVEVDQTKPKIDILEPRADNNRPNSLLLGWHVTDNNLTQKPITLLCSETSSGPWKLIAKDLPNTGQHSWRVPENTPSHLFLRVVARDQAGNEDEAITDKAILVDLSEPEGHLLHIIGDPTRPPQ